MCELAGNLPPHFWEEEAAPERGGRLRVVPEATTARLNARDAQVRNEKARRFLLNMRRKPGVNLEQYFPKADKGALRLLKRMLAFDPAERPTSEEALADPYFTGLSQPGREPSAQPVSKLSFDFERRKLTTDEVGLCISL